MFKIEKTLKKHVASVVATRHLPRDGDMAEDHGAQEDGNFPWPGPEMAERQRVAKERAAQRVCSWTT